MKAKHLTTVFAALVFSLPLLAVFNGENLGQTLRDLRDELSRDFEHMSVTKTRLHSNYEEQHKRMVDIMKECNELSLMLYSQKQEYTFDLSYALETVSSEYQDFNKDRTPYTRIVASMDNEIDRYARLLEALRRLPPELETIDGVPDSLLYRNDSLEQHIQSTGTSLDLTAEANAIIEAWINADYSDSLYLADEVIPATSVDVEKDYSHLPFILDENGQADRDSCIRYASELLKLYASSKEIMVADSIHYKEAYLRLKESYDYASVHYKKLQKAIFQDGQIPYSVILKNPGKYWTEMRDQIRNKYDLAALFREKGSPQKALINSQKDAPLYEKVGNIQYSLLFFDLLFSLLGLMLTWGISYLVFRLVFRFSKSAREKVNPLHVKYFSLLWGVVLYLLVFYSTDLSGVWEKATFLMSTFLWLLVGIVGTLLIRVKAERMRYGMRLYLPTIITAVIVIGFRITFVPNILMNLLFPPALVVMSIWLLVACLKFATKAESADRVIGWISFMLTFVALILSATGFIFVSLLLLVWWYFQLSAVLTIMAIWSLLARYKEGRLKEREEHCRRSITYVSGADKESLIFKVTWFHDLVKEVVVPLLVLISIPFCLHMSLNVFDFDDLYQDIYLNPFYSIMDVDGTMAFRLSMEAILSIAGLFFITRYLNRALHVLWQEARYETFMRKHNRKTIRPEEINLALGNSLISVAVWFIFACVVVQTLHIPMGSLSLVAGGLSAGIGLALKDVLNNFIYGIQLMSGRLKVGDWIECDGVRGTVSSITYQSTQVETVEGTTMSFLNASLFAKNFTNLTKSNSYEFLKIKVGVAYGTDIQKVREVLEDALQVMCVKDSYGRDVVEPKKGIYITFGDFADSAIEVAVKQYVLVSERIPYTDKAKEVVYNALNKNGITIPFPQCDLHVIKDED